MHYHIQFCNGRLYDTRVSNMTHKRIMYWKPASMIIIINEINEVKFTRKTAYSRMQCLQNWCAVQLWLNFHANTRNFHKTAVTGAGILHKLQISLFYTRTKSSGLSKRYEKRHLYQYIYYTADGWRTLHFRPSNRYFYSTEGFFEQLLKCKLVPFCDILANYSS